MLNEMEVASSNACIFTMCMGLFFIEGEAQGNQTTLMIIFVLMVAVNVLFMAYWGYWLVKVLKRKILGLFLRAYPNSVRIYKWA